VESCEQGELLIYITPLRSVKQKCDKNKMYTHLFVIIVIRIVQHTFCKHTIVIPDYLQGQINQRVSNMDQKTGSKTKISISQASKIIADIKMLTQF